MLVSETLAFTADLFSQRVAVFYMLVLDTDLLWASFPAVTNEIHIECYRIFNRQFCTQFFMLKFVLFTYFIYFQINSMNTEISTVSVIKKSTDSNESFPLIFLKEL